MGVEAAQGLLRHAWGGVRLQAEGPAGPTIDDDVDAGVIEPDPSRAFPRSRHDRRGKGCDQLMRPLRSEVFQVCTRWRLLRVGRHHATVEDAHAVYGSIGNELLKEVVASPLAPRGVGGNDRLPAAPRSPTLLGDNAIGLQQIYVVGSEPRPRR